MSRVKLELARNRRVTYRPRIGNEKSTCVNRCRNPWIRSESEIRSAVAGRNFRNRSAGLVIGGCPLLNTAIDSEDGNPQLREKARHALNSWLGRLESIIEEGQGRAEIRRYVEPSELATLIVGTLEGSLMMSRLQGKEQPRDWACRNLEDYLENNVRAKGLKGRGRKS